MNFCPWHENASSLYGVGYLVWWGTDYLNRVFQLPAVPEELFLKGFGTSQQLLCVNVHGCVHSRQNSSIQGVICFVYLNLGQGNSWTLCHVAHHVCWLHMYKLALTTDDIIAWNCYCKVLLSPIQCPPHLYTNFALFSCDTEQFQNICMYRYTQYNPTIAYTDLI